LILLDVLLLGINNQNTVEQNGDFSASIRENISQMVIISHQWEVAYRPSNVDWLHRWAWDLEIQRAHFLLGAFIHALLSPAYLCVS